MLKGFENIQTGITPETRAKAADVVDYLKRHATFEHPKDHTDICVRFNILKKSGEPNDVALRGLVNWLRSKGDPFLSRIGADGRGYYWINKPEEAQDTYDQLLGRMRGMNEAYRGLKRSLRQSEDQVSLL